MQIDFIDLGPTPPSELELEMLFFDFGAILIQGGWGYSPEDAVIVEVDPAKADHPLDAPMPPANHSVDYVGFEYAFANFRLGKELFVPDCPAVYRDVEQATVSQALVNLNGRKYDHLVQEVYAVAVADYAALKGQIQKDGAAGDAAFKERYNRLKRSCQRDYWFDITAFF